MLKKTIKYVDYNGVEREEDFFFNLSKTELMEMEIGTEGGLAERIQTIVKTKNNAEILRTFKKLLLASFGVKADDGKRFIKSAELSTAFEQSAAFSELFMELATNSDAAAAFINGIVPKMEDLKQINAK